MAHLFDDFQKFGKEHLAAVTTTSSSLAKSWQTIAAESSEYSKSRLRTAPLSSKSCSAPSHSRKPFRFSPSSLGKEAFKPIETAVAKVQGGKE
jgi:hypothetical protein